MLNFQLLILWQILSYQISIQREMNENFHNCKYFSNIRHSHIDRTNFELRRRRRRENSHNSFFNIPMKMIMMIMIASWMILNFNWFTIIHYLWESLYRFNNFCFPGKKMKNISFQYALFSFCFFNFFRWHKFYSLRWNHLWCLLFFFIFVHILPMIIIL